MGLIFLFKWDAKVQGSPIDNHDPNSMIPDEIFFARQTIQNACATQAILSVLLNLSSTDIPGFNLGPNLTCFKEFCIALSPELRGDSIGTNEHIRAVHNSFARPESLFLDEFDDYQRRRGKKGYDETPFHFISLLPVGGTLYEFDGLRSAPLAHGQIKDGKWLPTALAVLQSKIATIQEASEQSEIRFNLMAVVRDRQMVLQEQHNHNLKVLNELQTANNHNEEIQKQIGWSMAENANLEAQLEAERQKRERWRRENAMRRHNWIPLILTLTKKAIKAGLLEKSQ